MRYSLEKYSSGNRKQKVRCPQCNTNNKFVRYVDIKTNEILNENVGKCERIHNCCYHFTPKQYFDSNGIKPKHEPINFKPPQPFFYPDISLLKNTMSNNDKTDLYKFLNLHFDRISLKKTFDKYNIGYSNKFENSVVFWQVDNLGRVNSGKCMVYNSLTGRRDKTKFSWSKIPNGNKRKQCLFGLHLINQFDNYKVGIVESEKTALICDLFFDDKIIWLASGGERFLNIEKLEPLRNREVILFPDLTKIESKTTAFQYWKDIGIKAIKSLNINIKINQYLEVVANEKQKEDQQDLADFIISGMMS